MTLLAPTVSRKQPILGDGKQHPGRRMTEAEFVEWIDDKTRAEWVDGEVVMMAPANLDHADFSGWLYSLVREFVNRRQLGRVYGTEVIVRLPRQRRRRLPDVLFVSAERKAILKPTFVDGAPDLIMEVVSPDSVSRDWREKYFEYERAGVREYWIVHRQSDRVEAYALNKAGKYQLIPVQDGKIHSVVLKGFFLRIDWLLSESQPLVLEAIRELGLK
jgi:Uma2 family endonuclease